MTPANSSPSSCCTTAAARLVRQAKKVKLAATKVTTQPALADCCRIILRKRAARRLDCRKHANSKPVNAMSRGPACPLGTPGGSSPQVEQPQEQTRRCRWYSVTSGRISGNSHTWCRSGAGSVPCNALAQRRHWVGRQGLMAWHCSGGATAARAWHGRADHPGGGRPAPAAAAHPCSQAMNRAALQLRDFSLTDR